MAPAYSGTLLQRMRQMRGYTAHDMSDATGISLATYGRLEQDRFQRGNAPLRYYVQCAIVLECALEDIIEEELWDWFPIGDAQEPTPENMAKVAAFKQRMRERRTPVPGGN